MAGRFLLLLLLLAAGIYIGADTAQAQPSPSTRPSPTTTRTRSPPLPPSRLPPRPTTRSPPSPPRSPPPTRRPPPPKPSPRPKAFSPPSPARPATPLDVANGQQDCKIATALLRNPLFPLASYVSSRTETLTLFLPTDTAIALYLKVLGVPSLDSFPATAINLLLRYHVLRPVVFLASKMAPIQEVATALPGYNLTIYKDGKDVLIRAAESRAKAVRSILGGQGVVQVVDRVLVPFDLFEPPRLPSYQNLGQLLDFRQLTQTKSFLVDLAGLGDFVVSPNLQGTLFVPTQQAWANFEASIGKLVAANVIKQAALDAFIVKLQSDPVFAAAVLSDHLHLGGELSSADLKALTAVTVGGDITIYNTPKAGYLAIVFFNNTLQLSGLTAANVTVPDIYVGQTGDLVVHLVDCVLITRRTAIDLGLVTVPAPLPAPSGSPRPATASPPPPAPNTIASVVANDPRLTQFKLLIASTGLSAAAQNPNTVATVFAPIDAALESLNSVVDPTKLPVTLQELGLLVLSDHIHLGERLTAANLAARNSLALGLDRDLYASDRDAVLLLSSADGVLTISSFVGPAKVINADLDGGQSVLHVINGVLVTVRTARKLGFYSDPSPLFPSRAPPPPPEGASLAELNLQFATLTEGLAALPKMTTLITLYNVAASSPVGGILVRLLNSPYTLLAPTDDAFNAYFAATGRTLNGTLANPLNIAGIILPHIDFDDGAVSLDGLTQGRTLQMGYSLVKASRILLTVRRSSGSLTFVGPINSAVATASRIAAGPAQIHIVDTVIRSS